MDTITVTRSDKEYLQLERAAFSDPFSFLGPQYQSNDTALRVYVPGADSVEAITENGERFTLVREADSGFVLEGDFDFTTALYKLVVKWPQGEQTIYDPYQFHNLIQSGEALTDPSLMHSEMGAQLVTLNRGNSSVSGVRFLVFAPNASAVSVVGHFNAWDGRRHPMQRLDDGLWGLFIPELEEGTLYKFELKDSAGEGLPHKADPWGYQSEQYPSFASKVYDQANYEWQDDTWQNRPVTAKHQQALSFYELHAGSWRKNDQGEFLNYRELAAELIPYLSDMGYTHIELMPVSEHPFYGSWGYQPIGLFAPTSRFGSPDDFKYFVDQCHQANIGVVLDWVPAHFPSDDHGLANFDGTALFNDPDPRRGWHQDWKSYIYDYGRDHVRRFLVSNALFWFEHYHIDGLRVDAVASMLYLDYSREHDQWIPNHEGGNVNFDAVTLLRWVNEEVYRHYPNAMTIAEESTAYPGVTKPTDMGGLGFGFKWNMGWMHDSLSYMQEEPIHRSYHHNTITFPMVYAFSENYVLSLSHDEVVYGKGSLLDKMPGDEWQKTANLRAFMGYMYGQPGKKLNFMGAEIAQSAEWCHDGQLEWHWLQYPRHSGMQAVVKDLNALYTSEPAMYEQDCDPAGFEWRVQDDAGNSILAHERFALNGDKVLIVSNFTPVPREGYLLGVPAAGEYELLLNTDDEKYWGGNSPVKASIVTQQVASHGLEQSIAIDLPPLATVFYRFK
ncbi:1,4-alpha-glucan branching protein GlgB [Photobacterium sp. ZSDE20]|uniref:1,4-alpha-glucan branching enzyme GlgB n=1 Tax=Photobacterium pectinilyticum TaxID=2906793 RepID=A0ABT1N303_9GAMM|nr:1,4-alpha-glucan branching protein GlgB [Photobacterium sp. ZSDE20]MCQ1059116.1 1,4-alpha-glucan branching protein GlgB [Photobacterium sp. ZSDE20]MDD1824347.1 1,4-alpha-glucan branching protein GlgB [Photobacterium sp. ZSDE20]